MVPDAPKLPNEEMGFALPNAPNGEGPFVLVAPNEPKGEDELARAANPDAAKALAEVWGAGSSALGGAGGAEAANGETLEVLENPLPAGICGM